MVMYRAGEGPKPTTAPKPVPRAGPSPLPSPGPKSHEGTDAIPMDYFDKACMSPSSDSITEDLGRCLGSDCLCRACCRALAGLPPVDPDVTAEEKALEEATREARAARLSHHSENFEAGVAAAAQSMREAAAAEAARLEMEAQQAMADSVCLDEDDDDENYVNDDFSVTLDYTINLDDETLALGDDIRATTVPSHRDTTKRGSNCSNNNRRSSSKSNSSAEGGGYDCSIDDDDHDDDNDSVGSHSSTSSGPTVSGTKKVRPRRSVRRATRHSARPSRPSSRPAPKRRSNSSSSAPLKDATTATTAVGGAGEATNAEQGGDASDGDCAVDGRRCSGSGNELDLPDDESSSYSPNKQLFMDPVQSGLAPLTEAENEHPTPAKPSEAAAEARSALCDALNSATDASINSNNSGHKDEGESAINSTAGASSPQPPSTSVPPPSPANGMRSKPSHPSSLSSSSTGASSHRRSLLGKPMGTSMDSVLGSSSSSSNGIACVSNGTIHCNTGGGNGKGDGPDATSSSRAPSPLVRVVYSVALSPDPKDMPTTATTGAAAQASTGTGASYNVTLDDDDDINLYGESGYEAPDASDSLVKSPATKAHSSHGSAGGGSGGDSNRFSRQSAVGSVSTAQARKSLVQQRKDLDTRRQLRLAGGTSLDSVLGPSSSSSSPSSFAAKSPASKPKPSTHLQRSPALNNRGPGGRRSAPACLITEQRESEGGGAREGESSSEPGDSTQMQEEQPKEEGWVPIVTISVVVSEESPPCLIPESRPPKDSLDLVATTTSTSAATSAATSGSSSAAAALPRRPAPSRPRPRTAPLLETHKFFNSPEDGDQVPASNEEDDNPSCSDGQENAGGSSNNRNVFVSISKDERLESSEVGNDASAPMPSEPRPARLLSPDSVMFDDEEDDNFDESNISAAK